MATDSRLTLTCNAEDQLMNNDYVSTSTRRTMPAWRTRGMVVATLMAALPTAGWCQQTQSRLTNKAERGEISLEQVVSAFLRQDRALRHVETGYTVLQRGKACSGGSVLEKGVFGIEGNTLAARSVTLHAVYDGSTTKHMLAARFKRSYTETQGTASLFADFWSTPVLAFHRMQDTELTPVAMVLQDAVGPGRFGKAELLPDQAEVLGTPCYVVEGTYDRVKLNGLQRVDEVLWKYRLYFSPRHRMRMLRMETCDLTQNIPVGTVVVERLELYDDVWMPIRVVFKSYCYKKKSESLVVEHVIDNVIELDRSYLFVNRPPGDPWLFGIEQ